MPDRWTINRLADETGFDRRTVKKVLAEQEKVPEIEGKFEYYALRDFIDALVEHAKPNSEKEGASALEAELARKAARQADLLDIQLAERRNQVLQTETVFRVWEGVMVSIRRTILTSPLADAQKDAILNELKDLPLETFLEQQDFDQGSPAENLQPVRAASKA